MWNRVRVDCHAQTEITSFYGMIQRMLCRQTLGWPQLAPILAALLFSLQSFSANTPGAVIYLKNGKQIEADRVWEEGDKVHYEKDGNVYGFSKQLVQKVEMSPPVHSYAGEPPA